MIETRPALPSQFYDERHAVVGSSLVERYVPLFQATAALIPEGAKVVELGCGAGWFAPYALARTERYIGLDFAPALIAEAKALAKADFRLSDLRSDKIPRANWYVALEVLEHLDDDLALIRRLRWGAHLILSVPSFDSASHVRYFPLAGSARERYESVLRIEHEDVVPLPSGHFFHLLSGTVKAYRP